MKVQVSYVAVVLAVPSGRTGESEETRRESEGIGGIPIRISEGAPESVSPDAWPSHYQDGKMSRSGTWAGARDEPGTRIDICSWSDLTQGCVCCTLRPLTEALRATKSGQQDWDGYSHLPCYAMCSGECERLLRKKTCSRINRIINRYKRKSFKGSLERTSGKAGMGHGEKARNECKRIATSVLG
jgi:hypothetical protein